MIPPRKKTSDRRIAESKAVEPTPPREKTAGMPKWQRVAEALESDIATGRHAEGSRMPADIALAQQFDVNRHTVRRAIAELVKKGLVRTRPQIGTFVASLRLRIQIEPARRLYDTIRKAGFEPGMQLVSQRVRTPPEEVATRLDVAGRTPVIELQMVRLANDIPVAFVTYWLPADRFSQIGKFLAAHMSVRRAIAQAGVPAFKRKSSRILGRAADAHEAEMLRLEPGAPLLCLEVVDADLAGEPIAVVVYRFSAARVEFVIAH